MKTGALFDPRSKSARREIETLLATLQLPERGSGMGAPAGAPTKWFERISGFYRSMNADN